MTLSRLLKILLVAVAAGAINPSLCRGQNSIEDSLDLSKAAKKAQADDIYFDALKAIMHDDDKQAMELLEQFVAMKPNVSAAYYEMSKICYADHKADKAETYIKKALELDPNNKFYDEQYAALLADRGAYLEAANLVAGMAKANPQERSYPVVAAEYYGKAKEYKKALELLDKALQPDSTNEDILERKIQLYLSMNDVEKAAGVVKALIARDPQNGRYYHFLAKLYDDNKMPQKAAEVYEKAKKIIPDDPELQAGIAEHSLVAGDTAAYVAAIRKAMLNKDNDAEVQLSLLENLIRVLPNDSVRVAQGVSIMKELVMQHPADPQVLMEYGDMLAFSNQPDSAAEMYKRALAIKRDKFDDWEKLLNVYSDRKFADSLVKTSERVMRLFPNVALVSYYNAIGHMNKKEYPSAINAAKRAIDMEPESEKGQLAAMYGLLADLYHSNKQDDLSDKAFEKTLQLDPTNATVLNNYAYYLSERGVRLDEAEKMSQKSLELRPNEGTFLDTYGWIEYKKGNYLKAKDFVEQAIKQAGDRADGALYDHLGNICYQLNEKTKAMEYWKIAKQKGGDDPLIDKKITEGKLYE